MSRCPIRQEGSVGMRNCLEESCSFWDANKGQCLFVSATRSLITVLEKTEAYLKLLDMYRRTGGTHG